MKKAKPAGGDTHVNAVSIHIGLNEVAATHYGGTYPLAGCHNDANDMAAIARAAGYAAKVLLDRDATTTAILGSIADAARTLGPGDTFLVTYSGHGSQVTDTTGDESDGLDETWVLYDRMLLDDEIYDAIAKFVSGVRVLLISDSCHSGTIAKFVLAANLARSRDLGIPQPRYRTPDEPDFGDRVTRENPNVYGKIDRKALRSARQRVRAAVIQLAACQDAQVAADGADNGLFTENLKQVWASGGFRGDHRQFSNAICRKMPQIQKPNFLTFGSDVEPFERQRPFTIHAPTSIPLTRDDYLPSENTTMTMNFDDNANWPDVRAELERHYGVRVPANAHALGNGAKGSIDTNGNGKHASKGNGHAYAIGDAYAGGIRSATGAPIVRAFWWGFHIECSSQGLRDFTAVAQPLNAIVAAIGPVTGPAAPFVAAAAAFIAEGLAGLRGLDKGAGVYISMSWFAPGIFIPTTVPTREVVGAGPTGTRGFDVGEPYEQAGDPWKKQYGGGAFGTRLEEDIYWNLPDGTVRDHVIVLLNPPGFGNIHLSTATPRGDGWLSDDPTVGHFRLHVGISAWGGGTVELRMMIRDIVGRRALGSHAPSSRRAGPEIIPASAL